MNPNNTSNYLYIILLSLILIVIGAPGCNTIEAGTAAGKPGSSNPLATETQVVNKAETGAETTPMPDNLTYVNNVYGFEFEYPGTWTLSEENHGVLLLKGRNRLGIRQRWVDEEISPNRTGIPAGELVYGDKIQFMGKVIPAEFLQFECKNKIVFYGGTGDIEIDDLMFSITLEDRETYDYREIDLSEEVLDEAKAIVKSFRRIDRSEVSTQAPIALETGLRAHIEIPEILPVGENVNLKFVLKNILRYPAVCPDMVHTPRRDWWEDI